MHLTLCQLIFFRKNVKPNGTYHYASLFSLYKTFLKLFPINNTFYKIQRVLQKCLCLIYR